MLKSIDCIEQYLCGVSFDAYLQMREKRSAVERELQMMTEAAHRLGKDAEILCSGQNRRDIRGLGNALRHAYDSIDGTIIWKIVQEDLPPLKVAVQETLGKLPFDQV